MNPKTKETADRLNLIRILSSATNGLSLEELKIASGIESELELKKALGKLYMVGTYPYTPMDFLELDYDGTKARLHFPQNLNKTIALTPREWVLLRDSLESEKKKFATNSKETKAIDSILLRIKKIVPYDTIHSFQDIKVKIRDSIAKSLSLQFDYLSKDLGQIETRKIDPWFLIEDVADYLIGYCHSRKSARNFRLTSMGNMELTTNSFQPPEKNISQKSLDQFKHFIDESSRKGGKATFLHTRSAYYYLNQLFQLTPTGNTKTIKGTEYIQSQCAIRDEDWFLENISGFLPDIILEEPKSLANQLINTIQSASNI